MNRRNYKSRLKNKYASPFATFLMLSSLSLPIIVSVPTAFAENTSSLSQSTNNDSIQKQFIKISFENRVVYHEEIPTKTLVQVFNNDNEVIKSDVLKSDTELTLEKPSIPENKMFSYWDIQLKDSKLEIKPVMTEQKELSVSFLADEGGSLLRNNAQVKSVALSVDKDTLIEDILPTPSPKENYKFTGWFKAKSDTKIKDIEKIKVSSNNTEYVAKFYPDLNNNNIDDRTEKLQVSFETNSDIKLDNIEVETGKTIKLPSLKQSNKIFIGWFKDKDLKDKFSNNDEITESLTLYAKWEDVKKVIDNAEKSPITDVEISKQVEDILNSKLKNTSQNLNTPSQGNTSNSQNSNGNADKTYESSSNSDSTNSSPNNSNDSSSISNSSNSSLLDKKQYVFDNKNIGKKYMFKFYDENDKFIFSLILPYGKTIKTLTQDEELISEYSVRQDTTVKLDSNKIMNEGYDFLGYNARTVQKNSSEITEIVPKTKKIYKSETETLSDNSKKSDSKISIIAIGIALLFVIASACSFVLYRTQRKRKE